jgi:hypothetical protein
VPPHHAAGLNSPERDPEQAEAAHQASSQSRAKRLRHGKWLGCSDGTTGDRDTALATRTWRWISLNSASAMSAICSGVACKIHSFALRRARTKPPRSEPSLAGHWAA